METTIALIPFDLIILSPSSTEDTSPLNTNTGLCLNGARNDSVASDGDCTTAATLILLTSVDKIKLNKVIKKNGIMTARMKKPVSRMIWVNSLRNMRNILLIWQNNFSCKPQLDIAVISDRYLNGIHEIGTFLVCGD